MAELAYKLTRDTLFKIFFVKNPDFLKRLVSQIIGIAVDAMTEFEVTNSSIAPENIGEKFCHLDIKMKVNGEVINIEVQVDDNDDYPERSLYYWARSYSSALPTSGKYIDLPRTITISIVAFKMFDDTKDVHSEFRALEVTRHTELTDRFALHYFELQKLPEITESDAENELKLWLAMFNANTDEDMSKIETIGGEKMAQAVQAFRSVIASDDFKEIELLHREAKSNEASALWNASQKSEAKGKAEGKAEMILSMHEDGLSIEDIARISKLTEEKVREIILGL